MPPRIIQMFKLSSKSVKLNGSDYKGDLLDA